MNHVYVVYGKPIPLARPRFSGPTRRCFDSQKALKNNWSISIEGQAEGQPYYERTPLHLEARFYFPVPMNYAPRKKELLYGQPYPYKGDLDNLIKWIMDNCNAILFDDDCTVVSIHALKQYDADPRTEFSLQPYASSPDCNRLSWEIK